MNVAEIVMPGRVQLDELMIGTIDVSVEENAGRVSSANVADIRDRSFKPGSAIELLLVSLLHVLCAPADVPDRRSDLRLRRRGDFAEQQPGFLRPYRIQRSGELAALAIELAGVEIDVRFGIGGVEMNVVEMGER